MAANNDTLDTTALGAAPLDVKITSATIVDGTGEPSWVGDVGVREGRIVAVQAAGTLDREAVTTIDGTGLVLCPGFVDVHTHYDAQLFWDATATPSNLHGVTSVVGGNCSFGLAPLRAEDADSARRLLAKVEGMPLGALEVGVPWIWESFREYLDALDGNIAVNAGFLVGHSALRKYVLGEGAGERESTPTELEAIRALLAESLIGGGLGFSTDTSNLHSDGRGGRVPARGAGRDEVIALCAETGAHPGTSLAGNFAGTSTGFTPEELDLLTEMSTVADRPVNWNLLVVDASDPDRLERHLAAAAYARARGGRVVALAMPVIVPMNMSFGSYCALNLLPGWGDVMNTPRAERSELLRDPEVRARMLRTSQGRDAGFFSRLTNFGTYVIGDTYSAANAGLTGRDVNDIAAERGTSSFDTLLDIVLADDLRTVLWPAAPDDDAAHWAIRSRLLAEPDVLVGGSDAGAHLDRMCGGSYPTQFLADCLRGRQLVSLERAVHLLADVPARLLGLRDRGRVALGAIADLVLFDPATVAAAPARLVHDLPTKAPRLTSDAVGVRSVFVAGVETVHDGAATGARPGVVLRSGRDTDTVTVR
jgi:N-acyl-D-aspartate/D-glutamate deacylase